MFLSYICNNQACTQLRAYREDTGGLQGFLKSTPPKRSNHLWRLEHVSSGATSQWLVLLRYRAAGKNPPSLPGDRASQPGLKRRKLASAVVFPLSRGAYLVFSGVCRRLSVRLHSGDRR
ncbi:unnamed protein product [Pleuronectes platessa]|uniref:Uncharacterized protein n=1 Tax=Pleuronectes platessa TaxID=8262 RepID=A0A9N7V356_PLEPL|nr:unnamed protein product [Pleuronectes platessa]